MKKALFLLIFIAAPLSAMEMSSQSSMVTHCYYKVDEDLKETFEKLKKLEFCSSTAKSKIEEAKRAEQELIAYFTERFETQFEEQQDCVCNSFCCFKWVYCPRLTTNSRNHLQSHTRRLNSQEAPSNDSKPYYCIQPTGEGYSWLPYVGGCTYFVYDYGIDPNDKITFDYEKASELLKKAMPYVTPLHPNDLKEELQEKQKEWDKEAMDLIATINQP